jgi:glycerol-3-phosphate acyltransferase PlsY
MRGIRVFNMLAGVTTLAVFLQAISAGIFMSFRGGDAGAPWVTTHDVVADVAVVLALATAVVAIVALRRSAPGLMGASIALVVMLVLQTLIGHWIEGARWLVAIHVPLAMLVFAVTIWLSVRGAVVRRRLASEPGAAAA